MYVAINTIKTNYNANVNTWQGRQDLNLRHLVLETSALPTELLPYIPMAEGYSNSGDYTVQHDKNHTKTVRNLAWARLQLSYAYV